jgi:putative flavoprotein involved in K+ transport
MQMTEPTTCQHFRVVVIGGGQAGLAMSHHLQQNGIDHVILEKNRIAHAWRTQRWDAFCLVTPNWQCRLPGFPYSGDDPKGFMLRDEIVAYIEAYAKHIAASIREGVAVTRQLHSSQYRNPDQLPSGEILVIGSGQSGCQIAEDLHLAGRKVHLAVGSAPRCPRVYRGRDAVEWLDDLGQYDLPVDRHSLKEKVRKNANHYLTGRDGGRDIDLRRFALEGMTLYGRLNDVQNGKLTFADDLSKSLDNADRVYNGICSLIDDHIARNAIEAPASPHYEPVWRPAEVPTELDPAQAGLSAVIWTTGFKSDWSWVDLPIFDGAGYPTHRRGVTSMDGVYMLGLPWLYTWGSGRFVGVGRDAAFICEQIAANSATLNGADTNQMNLQLAECAA